MKLEREALPPIGDHRLPSHATSARMRAPAWKRGLDIALVLLVAPILLPVAMIIAAAVRVGSAGPVFFRQERIGFRGEKFVMLKFRTMKAGADQKSHEAHVARLIERNLPLTKLDAKGDARVTRVGAFLRASAMDELPQLVNVLWGQMSLVGPRPSLQSEYEKLSKMQQERFSTLPGMTGLWQVSGKNRTTFDEMIDLDIRYARTKSLSLDVWILLRTLPVVMDGVVAWLGRRQAPQPTAD